MEIRLSGFLHQDLYLEIRLADYVLVCGVGIPDLYSTFQSYLTTYITLTSDTMKIVTVAVGPVSRALLWRSTRLSAYKRGKAPSEIRKGEIE